MLDIGSIEVVEGITVVEVITPTESGPTGPTGPQGPPGISYDTPYENVAASATITTSASTTISGSGPTARGFNDYWQTTYQNSWIKLNLGQAYNVSNIIFGTRIVTDLSQTPETFTIDYSLDDINYYNIITKTDNDDTLQNISANGVSAQYIRITVNTLQPLSASVEIAGLLILTENNPAFAGNRPWEMIPNTNDVFLNTWGRVGIGTASITDTLTVNGNIIAAGYFTSPSDIRLKKNIQDITNPLNKICSLHGFGFNWKEIDERDKEFRRLDLPKGNRFGFSAQEVMVIFPELVLERNGTYSIDQISLIPIIVEAIKELHNEINQKLNKPFKMD